MKKHWCMKHPLWEAWRTPTRVYTEGDSFGTARLEKRSVDVTMALRAQIKQFESGVRHTMPVGDTSTQLVVGRGILETLWMSDSKDEFIDCIDAIEQARGRVLIHGLGLGCYLHCILAKPEVAHVDVVEKNEHILGLITPYFMDEIIDERLHIYHDDAFKKVWPKGTRWNFVWHDIWPTICSDDLEQHAVLNRKFGHRADVQACWKHQALLNLRGGLW